MRSVELLKNVEILEKSDNYHEFIQINYLSDHTTDVKRDTCFVCIKGNKFDSHERIDDLIIKPILIIVSKKIKTNIPYVIVKDTEITLPLLTANFYNHPSDKLNLIGVTGTDGKTTTALIIKQLLDHFSNCAYIGTNGFMVNKKQEKNSLTTPKPINLNRLLTRVIEEGNKYTALEVSSQGIEKHRIDHMHFKVAVFTNLTHEHLDYHKTIENYFLSKLKLFQMLRKDDIAVINIDSPYGKRIINNTLAQPITYGMDQDADFRIRHVNTSLTSTKFTLETKFSTYHNITLNLFGDYNVYNATAALCSGYALGYKIEDMIPYLNKLIEIEGRMHIVNFGQPFTVIIDFAHTPNALYYLLKNLESFKTNELTVVFGSAGERDHLKRPLMGEVVNQYATKIFVTNEDPKSEDEYEIIQEILQGIKDVFKVSMILNRKMAIIKALEKAQKGDIVVITGKGNEKIQMFDGYIEEHNDIAIAEKFLQDTYQNGYVYSIANM